MSENPLIGYWKLISCDALRNHGNLVPVYGRNPSGRLYYDDKGNMSVHIMRSGRRRGNGGLASAPSDEEIRSSYDGYQAYFATYTVDTARQVIRHEVLGSLFPDWTGSTQVRYYELPDDKHLLLSTGPIGSEPGDAPIFQLVWERLK